ncbi:hypothetical protein F2P56_000717 [Juglans regia]|uniref:non-specific serine/threonine protein kinase n=2 Tax=Juglans regia TaxID=51240 RepID=A0A834D7X4_JUGRE|nr:LEAF RUST 10 DISEASE-RESISTANCE LOCUS RECEPTOR-LIKE PROTEIN KINASE-like 2.7 [Juglans regia]KAF5479935.1 hypothetical protein F2P56_000717 [Juglans regia]
MHTHLVQIITLSAMIISIGLIHFPSSSYANNDEQYLTCGAPFECAGIRNLGYPFWESNRRSYCGHPSFQLNCSGDVPQLNITGMNYRVLEVNIVSRTLKVARTDYWKTISPPQIVNTTIDYSLFSYTDATNLTLYYDCTVPDSSANQTDSVQLDCTANNTDVARYNVSSLLGMCMNNVKVPVARSAAVGYSTEAALIKAIDGGFMLEWDAKISNRCDQCQKSGGQCGFNSTRGNDFACHCETGTFPLLCTLGKEASWKNKLRFIIPIGVVGIAVISLGIIIFSVKRRRSSSNTTVGVKRDAKNDHIDAEEMIKSYGSVAPKRYTYSAVKKLTNSFKDKVGRGGYGVVYKGKLPDGRVVAVKVLSESKGNGEEFINEVASISGTSHVNIVTLLGFCYEKTKRALIYEFVPNGSLDKFIYDDGSSITKCHLDKTIMFQIALGIARGLEYLHRGCRTRILHLDIKPHNILLGEDLCPKISDFGLAKLCKTKDSIVSMTGMRGTVGYIAPEVFSRSFGGVSHKSDVYSYGMLVLEMVGGRKNYDGGVSHTSEIYFPQWIYNKLERDEIFYTCEDRGEDEEDIVKREVEEDIVKRMIIVSLWCIQTNPLDRPSMGKVIEMLECNFQSLQIPPKPFLNSPAARSPENSSTAQ